MQTLVKWWAEYPGELLEARVVKPLQQYLTDELVVTKKLTVSVMNTIKVLAKVEEANQLGRLLPPDAFYNQLIRCCTCCRAVCGTGEKGWVVPCAENVPKQAGTMLIYNIYIVSYAYATSATAADRLYCTDALCWL